MFILNIQKYFYIIRNRQVVSLLGLVWRLIFYREIHLFSIFINIKMVSVKILHQHHLLYNLFITKKISTSIFISSGENGIFSVLMAVYFLIFTAINANPISFCPLDFPRTDIRVKPKLAFTNTKKGSTSILRFS